MDLDLAGGEIRVHRFGRAGDHFTFNGDNGFGPYAFQCLESFIADIGDDLGDAIMVPKVHEEQVSVIALPVNPAGKLHPLANLSGAQFGAIVGAIGVHSGSALVQFSRDLTGRALQRAGALCQGERPPL